MTNKQNRIIAPAEQAPPSDMLAEQALLGALLIEPAVAIPAACEVVTAEDFYSQAHRALYAAIVQVHQSGQAVDLITVKGRLEDSKLLEKVGGLNYLLELTSADAPAVGSLAGSYAKRVKQKAEQRRYLQLAQRLAAEAGGGLGPPELNALVREELDAIEQGNVPNTFKPVRVSDFLAAELPSVLWIVQDLVPGAGLTFIYGKPGTGKSFLAFEMARCVAAGQPLLGLYGVCSGPVVYFNLEMPEQQLQGRVRSLETLHPVGQAPLHLLSEPLALNDPVSFGRFRRLCEGMAPALVVIDCIIRALPGVDENSAAEVSAGMAPAADLARQMGFGLVVVHHSTKGNERDGLDSLAGSRDFAARADVALRVVPAEGGDGLLRVTAEKARWTAPPAPFYFRLQEDGDGNLSLMGAEPPSAKRDVLDVLRSAGRPLERKQVVSELDGIASAFTVDRALKALVEDGAIEKVGRGTYRVAAEE